MGQEYRRTQTTVSLINYYFVLCLRYRRKVLVKDVDIRFREIPIGRGSAKTMSNIGGLLGH